MSTTVATAAAVIDQRHMSTVERFDLAHELRLAWWDCHPLFMEEIVDLRDLGLGAAALSALAADFDAAGYPDHAAAARLLAEPSTPRHRGRVVSAGHWRARIHPRRAVLADA